MKKLELNTILKELDYSFIKYNSLNIHFEGKRIPEKGKGFKGGSVGTYAYLKHNKKIENKIREQLNRHSVPINCFSETRIIDDINHTNNVYHHIHIIQFSENEWVVLKFYWLLYDKYAGNKYDSAYKNYWYVILKDSIKKSKKGIFTYQNL